MNKETYTIEQLEKEKEKLKIKLDITRDAFEESLANNRKQFQRFLLENVAIPAGILGLGKIAINQLSKSEEPVSSADEQKKEKTQSRKNIFKILFKTLFPVALNIFQAFLLRNQKEKMQVHQPDEASEKKINSPLKSVS